MADFSLPARADHKLSRREPGRTIHHRTVVQNLPFEAPFRFSWFLLVFLSLFHLVPLQTHSEDKAMFALHGPVTRRLSPPTVYATTTFRISPQLPRFGPARQFTT